MSLDVLIIGAGLAGLTAARDCQAAGLTYKVLEARDRIGGKTWTVPLASGKGSLDMGAAWINPNTQKRIGDLAKQFNLSTVEQNTQGSVAFLSGPHASASRFPYGSLPKLDPLELDDVQTVRDTVQRDCLTVNLRNWSSDDRASTLASTTFAAYVQDISKTGAGLQTVRVWTRAMLGLEPEEISAMFFLDYCRSGGSLLEMRSDREDGAQYLRFPYGTQQFAKHLAAGLRSESIILSSPVIRIEQHDGVVSVQCSNTTRFTARKVIITVPSPLYATIDWVPSLPTNKAQVMRESIQGYYTKVILVYAEPWWRKEGFCGLSQSFDAGPIAVTRDTSDEKHQWSLTCFVAGEAGRKWSRMQYWPRVQAVKEQVCRLFESEKAYETTEVHVREWSKEEWSHGAPCPAQSPTSALVAHGCLRTPVNHVHFAGTETAYEWTGYMDGAVESGIRAASEVIEALST